ncbi:MAG: TrkH family potassium uptake protein [Clostridiales bacterium]|nr:TrkH family potassium uptake protein [Clostridiales bacterium]
MNFSVMIKTLGWVITFEGIFLFLPCLVALIYGESEGIAYLIVMGLCLLLGLILTRKKADKAAFYAKEGFITVALSWIVLSLFGALPFLLSRDIPDFTNALFETISGFTTTGASILPDVEGLSRCSMFWRSFTHWIGGMGVLVFILAILPLAGGYNIHLMRAESPGPSVGKLVPKIRDTALLLYAIYFVMTLVEVVFLLCGGMPLFDALTTSFGTAGTGGFGIKNSSLTDYSPYIQYVVTVFMILFGVNFNVYYLILIKRFKDAGNYEELRYYLLTIIAAIALITYNIRNLFPTLEEAFRHASFQVASIITTTGFSTSDFNLWPHFSKTILVVLMFVGACAGSTGGGIKVSRIGLLLKTIKKELVFYCHPKSIRKIIWNGRTVEHEVLRSVNVFMITYVVIFAVSTLLVSINNFDMTTNFTAVAATLNNIGPGLSQVGPTANFSIFSVFSKYVLMFDMLAGRLELFPMLILFSPVTWKGAGLRQKLQRRRSVRTGG